MSTRYVLLDLVFLLVVGLVAYFRRKHFAHIWQHLLRVLGLVLVLTLIFDNVIIMLHLVSYTPEHLLGVYIFKAPVEDFAYAIGAVVLVSALWGNEP